MDVSESVAWEDRSVFSLALRRFVIGPVIKTVLLALGLVSGQVGWSDGADDAANPANAQLWLARARDVRLHEVKLMAERLGLVRLHLCLLGAGAHVARTAAGHELLSPSNAAIGSLTDERGNDRKLVTCDGPGLAGPTYAIVW